MGKRLEKGQKLYRENIRRRGEVEREVEEVTVVTVGTKYFTTAEDPDERFLVGTLKAEHGARQLYLTAQEITDEWARVELSRALRNVFDYSRVPLDVLQQMAALVPEQLAYVRKLRGM